MAEADVEIDSPQETGLVEVKIPFTLKKWNAVVKWKYGNAFDLPHSSL